MNTLQRSHSQKTQIVWKTALALLSMLTWAVPLAVAQPTPKFKVLYYNKSPVGAAYIHTSAIAAFRDSIQAWGRTYGFSVDIGADATIFNTANLAKYQTLVWDNISAETADALPLAAQRTAMLEHIKTSGFVGIHAALEANRWQEFVTLLGGAKMTVHTSETNELTAALDLDKGAANHPMVAGMSATGTKITLPARVSLKDEWYSYTSSPRNVAGVQMLYTLDETTFTPAARMNDHPIAWYRTYPTGGRMFYTGIGHSAPYLAQPFVKNLLVNAIFATAGMDATGTRMPGARFRANTFKARPAGSSGLTVTVDGEGPHHVTIRSLDGKWLAGRDGTGSQAYAFENLKPTGLVLVELTSPYGRGSSLVPIH